MTTLRLFLADQLSESVSSLQGVDKARDIVMLCEVTEEARYVAHHQKKIAFLFAAMRHFAQELEAKGVTVRYVPFDEAGNSGSFTGELKRAVKHHKAARVIVTEPGEYRVLEMALLLHLPSRGAHFQHNCVAPGVVAEIPVLPRLYR